MPIKFRDTIFRAQKFYYFFQKILPEILPEVGRKYFRIESILQNPKFYGTTYLKNKTQLLSFIHFRAIMAIQCQSEPWLLKIYFRRNFLPKPDCECWKKQKNKIWNRSVLLKHFSLLLKNVKSLFTSFLQLLNRHMTHMSHIF